MGNHAGRLVVVVAPAASRRLLFRPVVKSTAVVLFLACAFFGAVVSAQTTYGEEAAQRIRAGERVAPLEDAMFGEQVSFYNGSTRFRVVDVSLPSHAGLKVEFARNIGAPDPSPNFWAWDIDVPRISTLLPDSWTGATATGTRITTRTSSRIRTAARPVLGRGSVHV